MDNIYFVILAGGSGSRFYPLSTPQKPKQFLKLFGNQSMLQLTYERIKNLTSPDNIIIVTSKEHVPEVQNHLSNIKHIIGENEQKDTAAAIILAAHAINKLCSDAIMVVLPADHLV
jgi:mannose-1-phosphate guanylyltransferase